MLRKKMKVKRKTSFVHFGSCFYYVISSLFLRLFFLFLPLFFSLFLSCGGEEQKAKEGGRRIGDGDEVQNINKCSSSVYFSPESVTGESPLTVTFQALFDAREGADGITAVGLDFGGDGFVDIVTSFTQPQTSFIYTATYSSVGDFQDAFVFFWEEDGKRMCKERKVSTISVVFRCPEPDTELLSQVVSGKVAVVKLRVKNLPLDQVRFYGGVDNIKPLSCTPDPNVPNSCNMYFSFPSFGDWSFCWYAESYCGKKEEIVCSSAIISYPFAELFSYYFEFPVLSKYLGSKGELIFSQEPYIVVFDTREVKVKKKTFVGGDFIDMTADEKFAWVFRRRFVNQAGAQTVLFELIRASPEEQKTKTVISGDQLFGTFDFDVMERQGKKYAVFSRDLISAGDILVYDITGGEASLPICTKRIPAGGKSMNIVGDGFIFISTLTEIYVYKLNFTGDICEIQDIVNFTPGYSIDTIDIGGDKRYAVGIWSSQNEPVRGKFSAFKFDFANQKFEKIGEFQVIPNRKVDVLKLDVSPDNISRVAVSFRISETGEYKVKFFDIEKAQSIGGIDGFSLPSEPVLLSFLNSSTSIIIGKDGSLTKIELDNFNKTVISLSHIGKMGKAVFSVDCDSTSMKVFSPEGAGVIQLDITPAFAEKLTSPLPVMIHGDPKIKRVESVLKGNKGKIYILFSRENPSSGKNEKILSDIDFSFELTSLIGDIRTFAVGETFAIIGGSQGAYFANITKENQKFILLQNKQLKKVLYSSGYFFLFSGNDIDVMREEGELLSSVVTDYSLGCLDISVSEDGSKIFCLRSFGVKEFAFDGRRIIGGRERSFSIPAGNIIDSSYSEGYIFFITDLIISQGFGVINTADLKLVILSLLGEGQEAYGVDASPYCTENTVLFSLYGKLGGKVIRGFIMGIP